MNRFSTRSGAWDTRFVHLPNLIRASSFRLTLLYTATFCASALALLGFIYWSTVASRRKFVALPSNTGNRAWCG